MELTENQKKFLEKMKDVYPFDLLDWTIPTILENGSYDKRDANKINFAIKTWQQSKGI